MSRKTIVLIALLLLVGVVAYFIAGNRGPDGTRVYTATAERSDIQEIVTASGKIFPQTEVKISSDVSGEVIELFVEEGDSVIPNQLLARIDADAFQSQVARGVAGVNSSRANLANAQAQIETLRAQRAQAEANLTNAEEVYQRNRQLFEQEVISQAELETSRANYQALQASLDAAQGQIRAAEESARAARYGVQSNEATLNELRTNLRRTTLYAPMGGVVSLLNVEEGERVVGTAQMSGTELMRIANLNAMEVRVEVSENDVPSVTLGDKVDIEVDAYLKRTFSGTVTQIANSSTNAALADNVLNSDQVTNFEVRISIDPASYADLVAAGNPYPFRPGMSAGVDILTERAEAVVSLPIECVTTREAEEDGDGGIGDLQEVVFKISADTVMQVAVTTGLQDADRIQILSGISEGDEVVAGPYTELRNIEAGEQVNVVSEDDYYGEDRDGAK